MIYTKSILFVFLLSFASGVFSQTTPTPSNPSTPVPMPSPSSPFPPSSGQQVKPDNSSIPISPSPNQPPPSTISPADPFPKSQKDTVFRSIDDTPGPFGSDSVPRPRK
jgi:hypothetical protein